jgi:hypothetical protein
VEQLVIAIQVLLQSLGRMRDMVTSVEAQAVEEGLEA